MILIPKLLLLNLMSDQTDNVQNLLQNFGLSSEEIEVYLALLEKSPQSALELSKHINKGRTKIYRLLETLTVKGLVSTIVDEYGNKFEANSPRQLELLLSQKEAEIESLKQKSPGLFVELENLRSQAEGETKVLFYKGIEGLKQITWNSLKATDGIRIYEIDNMEGFLDKNFAEKVREEIIQRKIFIKQLINHKTYPPFTNHKEIIRNLWDLRYIDPQEIKIDPEVLIYNDVYAMYRYEHNEIFAVEIYNKKLAEMQKQIFEFIFKHSQKMTILNDEGEAKLLEGN